jgi:isopenicillin-N epimerase
LSAAPAGTFRLDRAVVFLNHGSFGACPRAVLEHQASLRERLEAEPVRFMLRELPPLLEAARADVAAFVGADPADLVFVPNATTGVNTVLRSLDLAPGDELLVTDHTYGACRVAVDAVAAAAGARVVCARVPFPLASPGEVLDAVLGAVGPATRLALLDHVTSPTALVLPIAQLVAALAERGVDTLVDGAHGPGMLPLDLSSLGAAYYVANGHKWLCAPKGAGFLHVRRDRQASLRPLVLSFGAGPRADARSRFQAAFGWTGTDDPTAVLCLPAALRCMGGLLPGGWPALRAHNHALALRARDRLRAVLGCAPPAPDAMLGSMATLPLPDGDGEAPVPPFGIDPLQERLWAEHRIDVPVMGWPATPRRVLRVSAQLYNEPEHYERLAGALAGLLAPASR